MVRVDDELNLATLPAYDTDAAATYNVYQGGEVRPSNPYKVALYIAVAVLAITWMRHSPVAAENRPTAVIAGPDYQQTSRLPHARQDMWQTAVQPPAIAPPSQSFAAQQPSAADEAAALALYKKLVTEQQNGVQNFLDGLRAGPVGESDAGFPSATDTSLNSEDGEQ